MRTISESLDILAAEIAAAPEDTNTHRKKAAALARLARQTEMNAETREHAAKKEINKLAAALNEIESSIMDAGDVSSPPEQYGQRAAEIISAHRQQMHQLEARAARAEAEADRMSAAARSAGQCEREERQSRIDAEKARDAAQQETRTAKAQRDATAAALEKIRRAVGIDDEEYHGTNQTTEEQVIKKFETLADEKQSALKRASDAEGSADAWRRAAEGAERAARAARKEARP